MNLLLKLSLKLYEFPIDSNLKLEFVNQSYNLFHYNKMDEYINKQKNKYVGNWVQKDC